MKSLPLALFITILFSMVAVPLQAADELDVPIGNDQLSVTFDHQTATFSAQRKGQATPFLVNAKLSGADAKTETVKYQLSNDATFGEGKAVEIAYADGSRDSLTIYPNLPFLVIRRTLHNGTAAATVTEKVSLLSAQIDLGKPVEKLKVLGTGGLEGGKSDAGSYVWLAAADPETRHGVVTAWLTNDRGSGVVLSKADGEHLQINAQIDYGHLQIAPGKDANTETLLIGGFDDARVGLEQFADAVAKNQHIHLHPQPTGYCTWYSEKHGGSSNAKALAELSEFAAKELKPFGFNFVQIDDGWQSGEKSNGPRKNFAAYDPAGSYAAGMKPTADQIKSLGLTPGIWFMPFAGTYKDPVFKDHQDWFAKTADGKPFDTAWGGTCMDMTVPGAREYLRSVVHRIAHEWGYTYFKMDGMYTGTATRQVYVNASYKEDHLGESVLHDPAKTHIEAYRDGLRVVREAAGDGVFILGCCAPQNMRSYGGAFGMVDAMRIGPDNGADWNGLVRGPEFGSRNYFLNGRVWYNDPDPMYVRESMPLEHAQLIASWVTISGQLSADSDWLPGLPADRLNILRRTMPSHTLFPRPVDLFENNLPRIWLLSDTRRTPRRDVIALFNWKNESADFDYSLSHIGLDPQAAYIGFDFWANRLVGPFKDNVKSTLPKQSCQILAVRPVSDHPQLISTSRHITQGIVDVTAEAWDPAEHTLSGTSEVVGGDPYELRIATGDGANWTVKGVEEASHEASAKLGVKQEPGLVRVTIESEKSRSVQWIVRFEGTNAPGK